MGFKCYYCEGRDRISYFSNWCEDCANLRRLLLIYEPNKCINILKRTLTRDDTQITYKINQEIKKIVNKDIAGAGGYMTLVKNIKKSDAKAGDGLDDHTYETRSKKKSSSTS